MKGPRARTLGSPPNNPDADRDTPTVPQGWNGEPDDDDVDDVDDTPAGRLFDAGTILGAAVLGVVQTMPADEAKRLIDHVLAVAQLHATAVLKHEGRP